MLGEWLCEWTSKVRIPRDANTFEKQNIFPFLALCVLQQCQKMLYINKTECVKV